MLSQISIHNLQDLLKSHINNTWDMFSSDLSIVFIIDEMRVPYGFIFGAAWEISAISSHTSIGRASTK